MMILVVVHLKRVMYVIINMYKIIINLVLFTIINSNSNSNSNSNNNSNSNSNQIVYLQYKEILNEN
jgi:hypothetical protein